MSKVISGAGPASAVTADARTTRRAVRILGSSAHQDLPTQTTDQSSGELDEAETAEAFESPGADLSGGKLTVPVVPMQANERCMRCFLVHHRSEICLDCS